MHKKYILVLVVVIFSALSATWMIYLNQREEQSCVGGQALVRFSNRSYEVEIAKTDKEREVGLSYRKSMEVNHGMLFLFSTPSAQAFWMKEMFFPIHIFWIDAQMNIIGVAPFADPSSYPSLFRSPSPVAYVLEVNASSINDPTTHIGQKIIIECKKISPP